MHNFSKHMFILLVLQNLDCNGSLHGKGTHTFPELAEGNQKPFLEY